MSAFVEDILLREEREKHGVGEGNLLLPVLNVYANLLLYNYLKLKSFTSPPLLNPLPYCVVNLSSLSPSINYCIRLINSLKDLKR